MDGIRIFTIDTSDAGAVSKTDGLLLSEVNDLIDEKLPVTLLLAAYGNRAAGALAGAIDKGVFDIMSLYVAPEFRRKGIATALIEELRSQINGRDMMIRADYTLEDSEMESLGLFFSRSGFSREKIGIPCIYIADLGDLSIDKEEKTENRYAGFMVPFNKIPQKVLSVASNQFRKESNPLPDGGFLSEKVDRNLSYCVFMNGRISAYIAINNKENGYVEIPALWSSLQDPKALMDLLKKSMTALRDKYSPDTRTVMIAISSVSEKIILHLFPQAKQSSFCFISLW